MTLPWLTGWSRRWLPAIGGALLVIYAILRFQIFMYDRRIQREEAELEGLRPVVTDAIRAKELAAAVSAQQRFVDVMRASKIAWEPVFQRLASTLPATMVLHTMALDGTRMTLHGVLREPSPDPESFLASVAASLKRQGVFQAVTVAVAPRNPDEPSVVRVDLMGELR